MNLSLASENLLREIRLRHPCGEFAVFFLQRVCKIMFSYLQFDHWRWCVALCELLNLTQYVLCVAVHARRSAQLVTSGPPPYTSPSLSTLDVSVVGSQAPSRAASETSSADVSALGRGHGAIYQHHLQRRSPKSSTEFRSVVDVPPGTLAADKVSDSKFFVSSLSLCWKTPPFIASSHPADSLKGAWT